MHALRMALACLFTLLPCRCAFAQDPDTKGPALTAMLAKAEASVASVFVSRSDIYEKLGQAPADVAGGKLGRFAPADLDLLPGLSAVQRRLLLERLDLADPRHVPEYFSSAVVLDAKGLLLTNYHDVRDATKIFVRLADGTASYADIHAADPRSDLAVLRLLDVKKPLTPLAFGDGGKLKRGQILAAVGNPFAAAARGAKPTTSFGIVNGLRRRMVNLRQEEETGKLLHQYGSLLQVDARVPHGASGGALLDLDGSLVGLLTAAPGIAGDSEGAFAIPMDDRFRPIAEVLLRGEEVEYGFLGIGLSDRDFGMRKGVTVKDVYAGSPARAAKILEGDRIVGVDGESVENTDDLFLLLGGRLAGAEVKVRVTRPGLAVRTAHVKLAKLWSPPASIVSSLGARPFLRGLRVDDPSILVQQLPRWLSIPTGAVISDVQPGSAADEAVLKMGDVIVSIGDRAVATPADFYRILGESKGPVELTLYDATRGGPGPKVTLK